MPLTGKVSRKGSGGLGGSPGTFCKARPREAVSLGFGSPKGPHKFWAKGRDWEAQEVLGAPQGPPVVFVVLTNVEPLSRSQAPGREICL